MSNVDARDNRTSTSSKYCWCESRFMSAYFAEFWSVGGPELGLCRNLGSMENRDPLPQKILASVHLKICRLPSTDAKFQPSPPPSQTFHSVLLDTNQGQSSIMILSGREIIARQLVRNLRNVGLQQQPCGVDLTLRQVFKWTSAATIDFDNAKRQAAKTCSLPFDHTNHTITLPPGAYLVDFNETVKIPMNCMASVFPRSSLWRSGVTINAGIVDAGYRGAMGALMEVKNPNGVILCENAKLAQIVFEEMGETVEGYNGVYQASTSSVGRDGSEKA